MPNLERGEREKGRRVRKKEWEGVGKGRGGQTRALLNSSFFFNVLTATLISVFFLSFRRTPRRMERIRKRKKEGGGGKERDA